MADRVSQSYIGVRRRKSGKWTSEMRDPKTKKQVWIGSFETAEMAARAHDDKAFSFRGFKARLNFPEDAHTLPSFRANPSIDENREVASQSVGATAISESGGGEGSISGVENNPPHPIQQLSPSQIEFLRRRPLYSPQHPTLESSTSDFVENDADTFDPDT